MPSSWPPSRAPYRSSEKPSSRKREIRPYTQPSSRQHSASTPYDPVAFAPKKGIGRIEKFKFLPIFATETGSRKHQAGCRRQYSILTTGNFFTRQHLKRSFIGKGTDFQRYRFFRLMHPGPDKFPVMKAERYEIRSHTCHALPLRTGTGPHEENRSRMPPSGQRLRLLREQRLRQAHACCRERSRARLPHGDALAAAFCSHAVCIGLRRGGCRQGNRVRQGGQCRQGHHRLLCGTHQPPHLFRTAGLGHH